VQFMVQLLSRGIFVLFPKKAVPQRRIPKLTNRRHQVRIHKRDNADVLSLFSVYPIVVSGLRTKGQMAHLWGGGQIPPRRLASW